MVRGSGAWWCARCGAVHNGRTTERPTLHDQLRDAVKAYDGRPETHVRTTHFAKPKAKKLGKRRKGGGLSFGERMAKLRRARGKKK